MRCRLDRPVAARLHGFLPPPLPRPCPWAASMARRLAGSGDPRDRGPPYPTRQCARPTQQIVGDVPEVCLSARGVWIVATPSATFRSPAVNVATFSSESPEI